MKFLYPIKKLNLKPWIKYWLLKKTSGESTLKAVTLSEGTLTKVDKSKALKIKEYYGNTVQNGTPTPESPIPVQTISGENTFNINSVNYRVDLGGKNKLDLSAFTTTTSNGITVTPIKNNGILEYLESSGTYSQITYIAITNNLVIEPNTTYTLSGGYPSARIRLREYNNNTNLSEYWDNGAGVTFTSKSNVTRVNVQIVFYAQNNLKFYPQIELGTAKTEYSPYTDNPIELCKIGNYQDKIYYDSGKWYIEKNIQKVVLNGTENWYFTSNCCYTNNIVDIVKRPPNNNTKANILCDHYQIDTLANCYNNVTDKRISVNNGGYIYIYDTSFTSANAIKTWLGSNNVTVYYQLATPTTEIITNTNLISQLNALYEFYVNSSTVNISNSSEIPLEVLLEYYGR